jgi:hypothetical protein
MGFIISFVTLLLSSVISIAVIFYKIPLTSLQEASVIFLVLFLFIVKQFIFSKSSSVNPSVRVFMIFIVSTFLQLFVLSTGALLSPFIVLYHLFTISLIFLVNLSTAIIFLLFAISALIVDTRLNQQLFMIFTEDPFPVVLILLSFIVFVPLYELIASRYNIKAALSEMLTKRVKESSIKEQSLSLGLSDLVITTNTNLQIISANEAVLRRLGYRIEQLQSKYLLDILFQGKADNLKSDEINSAILESLKDQTVRIINNVVLYNKNSTLPTETNMQIRPITVGEGEGNQIMFIFNSVSASANDNPSPLTKRALGKYETTIKNLEENLSKRGLLELVAPVELLDQINKDILIGREIESHQIKPDIKITDIAEILQKAVVSKRKLAKGLKQNINLNFMEDFENRFTPEIINGEKIYSVGMTEAFFSVASDKRLAEILIEELINLCLLLGANFANQEVKIYISFSLLEVSILFSLPVIAFSLDMKTKLFSQYYSDLDIPSLRLGSGLEGFIAQNIASLIGLEIQTDFTAEKVLTFKINFSKSSQITAAN